MDTAILILLADDIEPCDDETTWEADRDRARADALREHSHRLGDLRTELRAHDRALMIYGQDSEAGRRTLARLVASVRELFPDVEG